MLLFCVLGGGRTLLVRGSRDGDDDDDDVFLVFFFFLVRCFFFSFLYVARGGKGPIFFFLAPNLFIFCVQLASWTAKGTFLFACLCGER